MNRNSEFYDPHRLNFGFSQKQERLQPGCQHIRPVHGRPFPPAALSPVTHHRTLTACKLCTVSVFRKLLQQGLPVIPLDQTILAMKSAGEQLPPSLCCTGLGGLSLAPAAKEIQKRLKNV